MEEWMYRCTFSLTSALAGGVVNFTPRPLYPRGKSPRYPLDKMSGSGGENKNLFHLSGI
jgi:hypothetical protein